MKNDKGRAVTRAIYNALGINKSGHKDLLGIYLRVRVLTSGLM